MIKTVKDIVTGIEYQTDDNKFFIDKEKRLVHFCMDYEEAFDTHIVISLNEVYSIYYTFTFDEIKHLEHLCRIVQIEDKSTMENVAGAIKTVFYKDDIPVNDERLCPTCVSEQKDVDEEPCSKCLKNSMYQPKDSNKKVMYEVLSPDGIPIRYDGPFETEEAREQYFLIWMKSYEHQGYYSYRGQRIPLNELREHCKFMEV